jgi:hypothetical protein
MKLNFSPVDKAFMLGSTQIKDTQEEINRLTKLILDSNINKGKKSPVKTSVEATDTEPSFSKSQSQFYKQSPSLYADNQTAVFSKPEASENFDYNLMKVISHPKFDDIVKNYALVYHPEWLLRESVYRPSQQMGPANPRSISYFGNKYQRTVCSDIKNYILFFIISVAIFVALIQFF